MGVKPQLIFRCLQVAFSLALVVASLRAHCGEPINRTKGRQCLKTLAAKNDEVLALKTRRIYSLGKALFGKIQYLNPAELQRAEQKGGLDPETLLVMDQFPTTEELPLVAGLIVLQPFPLEFTHAQLLAEKMEIPILQIEKKSFEKLKALSLSPLRQKHLLQEVGDQWLITTSPLETSSALGAAPFSRSSVLPVPSRRHTKTIYSQGYPLAYCPVSLCGEKFLRLHQFRMQFPHLTPPFVALSSGYYESFITHHQFKGRPLRYWLSLHKPPARKPQGPLETTAEIEFHENLAFLRKAIMESEPTYPQQYNVFKEALKDLEPYLSDQHKKPHSLRSNHELEDTLGNGLFRSVKVPSLNAAALEAGLKTIWASLFDDRAAAVRRFWGMNEENLSMPVLLHPYVDDILGHAVASVEVNGFDEIEMHISYVLGNDEKATNPSSHSKTLEVIVKTDKANRVGVWILNKKHQKRLSPELRFAFIEFYRETENFFKTELLDRFIDPQNLNLEFVVEKGEQAWSPLRIKVLQYKPVFSKEVALNLHNGYLQYLDLDKKMDRQAKIFDFEQRLQDLQMTPLSSFDPTQIKEDIFRPTKGSNVKVRFALVQHEDKATFFFWNDGRLHQQIKKFLQHPSVIWIKSGYMEFKPQNSSVLTLTPSRFSLAIDRRLTEESLRLFIESSFQKALLSEAPLATFWNQYHPQLEIRFAEGRFEINL